MTNQKRNPIEGTETPKRKRIPVSGNRDILTVQGKDPNYVYRFVNDVPGRIAKFQAAGYEVVDHDATIGGVTVDSSKGTDSTKSKIVGQDRLTGNAVEAYLMRIPKEYYEEDQAAKQQKIDEKEIAMKRETKKPGHYGNLKYE